MFKPFRGERGDEREDIQAQINGFRYDKTAPLFIAEMSAKDILPFSLKAQIGYASSPETLSGQDKDYG